MTQRELEKLARGPNPRDRVPVPKPGERCPRCHRAAATPVLSLELGPDSHLQINLRVEPCLLCAPHLVPPEFR